MEIYASLGNKKCKLQYAIFSLKPFFLNFKQLRQNLMMSLIFFIFNLLIDWIIFALFIYVTPEGYFSVINIVIIFFLLSFGIPVVYFGQCLVQILQEIWSL